MKNRYQFTFYRSSESNVVSEIISVNAVSYMDAINELIAKGYYIDDWDKVLLHKVRKSH